MNKNYLGNTAYLRSKFFLYFKSKVAFEKSLPLTDPNTYFVIGNVSKLLYSSDMVTGFSLVY